MIRRLPEETGMGVLMVSHSMEDMAMYADKIAVMDHGKLLRFGTPEQVFSEPEVLEKAGLGIPILSRLTLALKEKGLQLPFSKTAEEFAKNLKQALEGRGQHGDE